MPANALLIDDNPGHLDIIEAYLGTKGFQIRRETDGAAALHLLEQPPYPDIVVMDFMMPITPGATVYDRIRKMPEIKDMPIVVLSAIHAGTIQAKIAPNPATQFVSKPVDFRVLDAAMRTLLGAKYPR